MRYLGYILLLAVFGAGYASIHIGVVCAAAVGSTVLYANARRTALKRQPQALDHNMILDGAFLLALQFLIMFTVYILGWFLAHRIVIGAAAG